MEPKLSQSQSQRLVLAPQLRQFLKLLELPIFELNQKIEEELEQNPVLEEVDPDQKDEATDSASEKEAGKEEQMQDILQQMETFDKMRKYDESFEDLSQNDPEEIQRKRDYQEATLTKPPTLSEYLNWQLGFLDLSESEKKIAQEIIGNINDDGQLVASVEELISDTKASREEIEKVIQKIQTLDPPGVGGRDLSEILLIQLKKQEGHTALAQDIVKNHLLLLERRQFDQLARLMNTSLQKINEVYQQISHLEPKPGRIFYQEKQNFVVPDASVSISPDDENELVIEMSRDFIPSLRINSMYRNMLRKKGLDLKTKTFLREKVQAGQDLIRAIAQRKSTIQSVTEELVKAQRDFFTKGFGYLKPLRLKDISEHIRLHESTVSRAIQGKYLDTPQGTIPYKSFFSSKLQSEDGTLKSQKSVTERLKHLIETENKKKPFSDAKLVTLLNVEGTKIARRTVAKYRELLKILPAYLRKN